MPGPPQGAAARAQDSAAVEPGRRPAVGVRLLVSLLAGPLHWTARRTEPSVLS